MSESPYDAVIAAAAAGEHAKAAEGFQALENGSRLDGAFLFAYAQTLCELGRWAEAYERLRLALALEPRSAEALVLTGVTLGFLGRAAEAEPYLDRAVEVCPHMPWARWNRALCLLYKGDYAQGWAEYEWGRAEGTRKPRHIRPQWDGSAIPGKTLYIWAEQGFGDTIQFLRFVQSAKDRSGAHVVLEVQPQLLPLLARHPYADEVVAQSAQGELHVSGDFEHCALMSLPFILGIGASVGSEPYITAPDTLEIDSRGRLKVGVCWQGSKAHSNDKARSIPFEAMAPLLRMGYCAFISLQKSADLTEQTPDILLHTPPLNDWRETAMVIDALDLVITVDTAVAHLAAAMGKPTWILLSKDNDWRWGQGGIKTNWYESVTLFRQGTLGEWAPVVDFVTRRLGDVTQYRRVPKEVAA